MKILLVGTPTVALPTFAALAQSRHQIVGVLTRTPAARGRSRKLVPSEVGQWAAEHCLPVIEADSLRSPEIAQRVRATGAELAVVVAYGAIIPKSLLSAFAHGWINLHFSALPRWRGAAPVQRALEAGDETIATSIFQIEAGLDTGPVFSTREFAVDPEINAGELLEFLAHEGASQMVEVVDAIAAGTAVASTQPVTGITFAAKIERHEVAIDPRLDAVTIHNFVRARSPQPGAVIGFRGQRVKILKTRPCHSNSVPNLSPGHLWASKRELLMGTGDGVLEVQVLAPAGKAPMEAAAWARGARLEAHSCFENLADAAATTEKPAASTNNS